MKTTKPQPFTPMRGGDLDSLVKKAEQLSRINRIVNNELPKQARDHCSVGAFNNGELSLVVENGGWSTAIRYQQKNLIRKLQGYPEFHSLVKIQIKTRPAAELLFSELRANEKQTKEKEDERAKAKKLAGQFRQIRDPELRKAMQQLSQAIQSEK
ncbi:MAG: DUF721 domain-containing protein [Pseudomonadales bacterium]|nr:DUF721 domain-containing protein [Pseudomonadales bacterium]